jgi:hypothetical protein
MKNFFKGLYKIHIKKIIKEFFIIPQYKIYSTFVSKHYVANLAVPEILSFLNKEKLNYKIQGEEIIVKECPLCHETKNKISNYNKLYISKIWKIYM